MKCYYCHKVLMGGDNPFVWVDTSTMVCTSNPTCLLAHANSKSKLSQIPEDQFIRCTRCNVKMSNVNLCFTFHMKSDNQKETRFERCNQIVCKQCKHCKQCHGDVTHLILNINLKEEDELVRRDKEYLRKYYDVIL